MNLNKKIIIIGGGVSGLSTSCFLSDKGFNVTLLEKNSTLGGRARYFIEDGFKFDMGPSWYWMPDVMENFFNKFNKSSKDYFDLIKLDPGFQIIFNKEIVLKIPSNIKDLYNLFESIEPKSSSKLKKFLDSSQKKYEISFKNLIYKPSYSWLEYINFEVISNFFKLNLFSSMRSYVNNYFSDPKIKMLMEFPVLFLGAMPDKIPALYSMMNYSALVQGTYYPMGGMGKLIDGLESLAKSLGVNILTNCNVEQILVENKISKGVLTSKGKFNADVIVASADYEFVEQNLLENKYRNYNKKYWEKKIMAPSCLIYYLGLNKVIPKLLHHNLFFDTSFDVHAKEIYNSHKWPNDPLFYVCCPSKTDNTVAPKNCENLFILIPISTNLKDNEEKRKYYLDLVIKRIEIYCNTEVKNNIIYSKSYCINDFKFDYNAFKGNAYGLANTLNQTGPLKPRIRNKKIKNLFYTGQLTVPGPGLPPAFISGEIVSNEIFNLFR